MSALAFGGFCTAVTCAIGWWLARCDRLREAGQKRRLADILRRIAQEQVPVDPDGASDFLIRIANTLEASAKQKGLEG